MRTLIRTMITDHALTPSTTGGFLRWIRGLDLPCGQRPGKLLCGLRIERPGSIAGAAVGIPLRPEQPFVGMADRPEHQVRNFVCKNTSEQRAECEWNYTFQPSEPGADPEHPVTHVDFCDAVAFCAWAGKRLCGKIGGGELSFAELSLASESQWFAACGGPEPGSFAFRLLLTWSASRATPTTTTATIATVQPNDPLRRRFGLR